MPALTFARIAEMTGGHLVQGGEAVANSVVIDSRESKPGAAFFAIRGDRLDGHNYIGHALQKAEGAVVDRSMDVPPGKALVVVEDTTVALQALASAIRAEFPFRLIGITGSAGKTTTKEMIASLIATERRTWKSWGNFNNQIGFPLCLSNAPDDAEIVISEMGMNHAGELAMLAQLAPPDIAVYTNVAAVHLEFFDSIDGIAAAKRELLENMRQDGTVIINADDHRVLRLSEGYPGKRVLYGVDERSDVRAASIEERGLLGTRIVLEAEGERRKFELCVPGRFNAQNLLAAIATAREVGISWEGIDEGVRSITPGNHRGVIIEWRGAFLYDDTYNSNPYALQQALELLSKASCEGRRIAVVGDMLELGGDEIRFHRDIGRSMPRNIAMLIAVGNRSGAVLQGAREVGFDSSTLQHFADGREAAEFLRENVQQGDLVLLKASRGIGLDKVITLLQEEGEGS
jgi:UDP-N-acetylmuramoyl-tripeptide--D-alanyl-D-alanine ligase